MINKDSENIKIYLNMIILILFIIAHQLIDINKFRIYNFFYSFSTE